MAFSPISFVAVNYRDFSTYWVKPYIPGGDTPKPFALESDGGTQVAKLEINTDGFLKSAGGALVIPYIDGSYDMWMFPNEAEADANNTTNAHRIADDITGVSQAALDADLINDLSQAYEFLTVTAMQASAITFPLNKKLTTAERETGKGGGANYIVTTGSSDLYTNLAIAGAKVAVMQVEDGEVNAIAFGLAGVYQNDRTAIYALEGYLRTNKYNCLFPDGEYDVGEDRWPFKSDQLGLNDPLVDYGGLTLRGATRDGVIFSVTTDVGRDVLNMNKVSNITVKNLTLTSYMVGKVVQTLGNSNISNGCSLTGGTQNVTIDVDVINCLGVPKTSPGAFLDGGKAFTLQPGTAAGFGFQNVTMRGKALNCGYGTGMNVTYEQFNVGAQGQPYNGIDVDIIAQDCYRACDFSSSSATVAVSLDDVDWQGNIKVVAINCAQGLIAARWIGGDFDIHIINNKADVDLYRPIPTDQNVYAALVQGCYKSRVSVYGRMTACTFKYDISAASQGGGVGVVGQNNGLECTFAVDSPSITGGQEVITSTTFGNPAVNSNIRFVSVADSSYEGLLMVGGVFKPEWNNTLMIGGNAYHQNLNSQNITVERQGQAYNTFSVDGVTGDVSLLKAGSGSAGSIDGFLNIKDTNTGATYKIQLYT